MITTVFSTTDSPYMQWQSELLEYSWKEVGQSGELVRLVATDDPASLPRHRHARCVATRQWKIHPLSGDDFPPYNKPASLLEWIYREEPQGTLLLLDPDCVFRAPVEREVAPGRPLGQHWIDLGIGDQPPFGLGSRFEKLRPHCTRDEVRADPVMIPNLIHVRDMQRIALRWLELTGRVRDLVRNHQDNPMWESDMVGFIIASAEHGLRHELGTLGICTNWSPAEVVNAPIIHYCQAVRDGEGREIWSKGTYQPWERPPDPSRAADASGRDLLALVGEFVDGQAAAAPRPRRRPGVTAQRTDGGFELRVPGGGDAFAVNASARAIFELCDGERSVEAIAEELARRFDAPPPAILRDVEAGLRSLGEAGLVDL